MVRAWRTRGREGFQAAARKSRESSARVRRLVSASKTAAGRRARTRVSAPSAERDTVAAGAAGSEGVPGAAESRVTGSWRPQDTAMFAGSGGGTVSAVLLGIVLSAVLLVFVYKAIILTGKRLPLKPFFLATSILMFVMCVAFVGGGISEFVDASWITPHLVDGVPTISLLGIYPYVESLTAQAVMVAVILASLGIGYAVSRTRARKSA